MTSKDAVAILVNDIHLDKGNGNLVFIIGGSLGLADKVVSRANFKLSFSRMTFPHQLMRMMLMEQISRF